MQNKKQLRKELKRSEKQYTSVMEALEKTDWTPGQIDQMEWAAFQCSENIYLLECLLQE